jgi:hypothetical protein
VTAIDFFRPVSIRAGNLHKRCGKSESSSQAASVDDCQGKEYNAESKKNGDLQMSFIVQKQILAKHYADLCFKLEWAIDACPETLWNNDCLNPRYWYLVYHALFFMDIHLSDSPKGFQPPAPFEIIGLDFSGKKHERQYSKSQLKQYIVHIRKKAASRIDSSTEETMQQSCGFPWVNLNVEGLLLYNLKNVNRYASEMIEILDQEQKKAVQKS